MEPVFEKAEKQKNVEQSILPILKLQKKKYIIVNYLKKSKTYGFRTLDLITDLLEKRDNNENENIIIH